MLISASFFSLFTAIIAAGKKCVDSLALALPLLPTSLPKLNIFDIGLTKNRFVFEGRVLNSMGHMISMINFPKIKLLRNI